MARLRRCPACWNLAIRRPENHTCGSKICVMEWKEWSAEERAKRVRQAERGLLDVISSDSLKPSGNRDEDEISEEDEIEARFNEKAESATMPAALANILGIKKGKER